MKSESEVTQPCLTLSDPMDCNLPGSSDHGIFQARVLEWGAITFSAFIHILILGYVDLVSFFILFNFVVFTVYFIQLLFNLPLIL